MLVFTSILGPNLTAGGIMQIIEEVITVGQAMAFTVPFVVLALIALVLTIRLLRSFSEAGHRTSAAKTKKQNRLERFSTR
jgi:hypothetical protein